MSIQITESLVFNNHNFPTVNESLEKTEQRFNSFNNTENSISSGYRKLASEPYYLIESLNLAKKLQEDFDHMLVLGIGGSALGTKMIQQALAHCSPTSKSLLISENLDPIEIDIILKKIKFEKTVVVVISKSGGTLETIAQMAYIIEVLKEKKLPLQKHIVTITDPDEGPLKEWTIKNNIQSLAVPSHTGGRFSILSPVGFLPLSFIDIDINKILDGAQSYLKQIEIKTLCTLGHQFAQAEINYQQKTHVLMPYSSRLKYFGDWFVQLWGESLGKNDKFGLAPLSAVGDTDQHSLLQFLAEGPKTTITGLLQISNWPNNTDHIHCPELNSLFSKNLKFAEKQKLSSLLNAQLKATEEVLMKSGRMVYKIEIKYLNPFCLGQLVLFYEDLTIATASSLNLNPFNQPGVELGKKITKNYL